MSKEMHKSVRSVGTRPGTKYRIFKLHKQQIESNPQFPSIWLAFQIPAYKLLKFLVPILNHLTKGEYTHKVSFQFPEETCDQDPTMGDLDKDSLFTTFLLVKLLISASISCLKTLNEGTTKSKLKQLLCLATKESYFIFNCLTLQTNW